MKDFLKNAATSILILAGWLVMLIIPLLAFFGHSAESVSAFFK